MKSNRLVLVASLVILYSLLLTLAPNVPSEVVLVSTCLAATLIWLSVTDFERFVIPNAVVVFIAVGGVFSAFHFSLSPMGHLVSAAIVYVVFFLASETAFRKSGREYLGMGDVKLLAAGTLWIGWQGLPTWLLVASFVGILFAIAGKLRHSDKVSNGLPFGPFLSLGLYVTWLYGPLSY